MLRKFFMAFFAVLLLSSFAFAQSGKISGKVIDRETGDALPGANVTIVGTTLGAATDVSGEFIVLTVPTGVYTVKAEFIGYREVVIENVRVNSGLTTQLNFDLPSEAVEVSEISIVAERPLVNKNATNAVRIQSYEDMKNLPVRGVLQAVALQPGIIVQNNNFYIRGGRSNDVGYYLEGADVRDKNGAQQGGFSGSNGSFGGDNPVGVIPDALEEFQVQAGGYTAEFGGANAGIIRQTLKTGGQQYHGSFQFETDDFASQGNQFLNTYSYGYKDFTGTVGGPVPGFKGKMRFFAAGERILEDDRIVRFLKGFNFQHADTPDLANNRLPIVLTRNNTPEMLSLLQKNGLVLNDGNTPGADRQQWIGNGTLVYDAKPFIFRLGGSFAYRNQGNISVDPTFRLFNNRSGHNEFSSALINFKATHLVSPKTFYEVNVNYFDRRSISMDDVFRNNFWAYWDSTANASKGVQFTGLNSPWIGGTQVMDIYGFNFSAPGAPWGYSKSRRSYAGGSFALTTQQKQHEIKFGASYERWTARNFSVAPFTQLVGARSNPDQYRTARDAALSGKEGADTQGAFRVTAGGLQRFTYGYDVFGNEINVKGPDGARHPKYFSTYLQDKFEAKDLVINAGLRLDIIDNDDFEFKDPANPPWDRQNHSLFLDQVVQKKYQTELSPRIGLAFPVSDRTVFHMQYGRFVQAPRLTDLYNGSTWYDAIFTGGTSFQGGVVGQGLNPEITTQYEAGFNQQFSDNAAFDVTVFYKSIRDQIQLSRIIADKTSAASDYNVMQNGDFSTTSGVELSLTLRRTERVAAQINYTFSRSLGTGSTPATAIAGIELGQELPSIISPLDFHHPQSGSFNLDYRFGKGDGGPILQQLGLNLLATFSSGHPYTLSTGGLGQQDVSFGGQITDPRSRIPLENIGASLTPWNFTLNFRVDKTVNFGKFDTNFYVYVQNLTNKENVINVYDRTGNAFNDGFLSDATLSEPVIAGQEGLNPGVGGDAYVALYKAINLRGNGTNYSNDTGQLLLGKPRQIRFGARFEF